MKSRNLMLFVFALGVHTYCMAQMRITRNDTFPLGFFEHRATQLALGSTKYFIANHPLKWKMEFISTSLLNDAWTDVRFSAMDGDTLKNIIFELDNKLHARRVLTYFKKYRSSNRIYSSYYEDNRLHYSYYLSLPDSTRVFLRGEYSHRRLYRGFSKSEITFYEAHRDSLDTISGNGLPKLVNQRRKVK